jgi:diguanylate cyclase (GGDEF)-like protein
MDLPITTMLALAAIACLLTGALAGSAGFAIVVVRRHNRRVADLAERLADAGDSALLIETRHLGDRQVRKGFDRLAARLAESWTLATVDLLTAVLTRQALLTRLGEELERAARFGRQLSIVLVDLDHFKRLNDSYGHAAGDQVLHEVAGVLRSNVRSIDLVGRYGGEEFMVILPETDVDAAASVAEKLRRLVGSRQTVLGGGDVVSLTLSAGVAGGLGEHLRLDALIRDADAALYSAKALGRDQVYVFHEVGDDGPIRRAAIAPAARAQAVEVGRAAMGAATATLRAALEMRPGWAGGPSTMIAEAAVSVAQVLGLPQSEVDRIRTASLLHDLGKLAIPDEILAKPDELVEPEWRVVAEHPKIGQVVLEQAGALRDAATIVLHHHEWFDGRGYPHGLAGTDIPIGARIVAIADAYEAMVAGRPYRAAVDHDHAIAELRRHAGIQFDPELVELFASMFGDGMPWPIEPHGHDHGHPGDQDQAPDRSRARGHSRPRPRPRAADTRPHSEIHDALHARRRRVVRTARQVTAAQLADGAEGLHTGTEG